MNDNERQHTLYCIGGSLDGQVRTERGGTFQHLLAMKHPGLWLPGYGDEGINPAINPRRYRSEYYERRSFQRSEGEPMVEFWVFTEMSTLAAELNADARYLDAAVLQDEQLICE